jgi:hypothetical protein
MLGSPELEAKPLDSPAINSTLTQRPVASSRKQATIEAVGLVQRSDLQQQLADKTGGFVWKVEMWPNWLQVSVDMLGNAHADEKPGKDAVEAWFAKHGEEVKELVGGVLGERFPEIYVMDKSMGTGPHMGGCCRTGCTGCMNGIRNRLLPKLQGAEPTVPVDRLG